MLIVGNAKNRALRYGTPAMSILILKQHKSPYPSNIYIEIAGYTSGVTFEMGVYLIERYLDYQRVVI